MFPWRKPTIESLDIDEENFWILFDDLGSERDFCGRFTVFTYPLHFLFREILVQDGPEGSHCARTRACWWHWDIHVPFWMGLTIHDVVGLADELLLDDIGNGRV